MKRKPLLYLLSFLAVCVLLFGLLIGARHLAARYVETALLPDLARRLGVDRMSLEVRRIGLSGADLGPFEMGETERPFFSVGCTKVDYGPLGLLRGRVEEVTVAGLQLRLTIHDGRPVLPGLDLSASAGRGDSKGATQPFIPPPFHLERLVVRNGELLVQWEGRMVSILFGLETTVPSPEWEMIRTRIDLRCRGDRMSATATLRPAEGSVALCISSGAIHPNRFTDITQGLIPLTAEGRLTVDGETRLRLDPFDVRSAAVDLGVDLERLTIPGLGAITFAPSEGPSYLRVHKEPGGPWRIDGDPLSLDHPLDLRLIDLAGRIESLEGRTKAEGEVVVEIDGVDLPEFPLHVRSPLRSRLRISGRSGRQGDWEFDLGAETVADSGGPAMVEIAKTRLEMAPPSATIHVTGDPDGVPHLRYRATAGPISVVRDPIEADLRDLVLQGEGRAGTTPALAFSLTGDGKLGAGGLTVSVPRMGATGELNLPGGQTENFAASASLTVSGASVRHSGTGLRGNGIALSLPVAWPPRNGDPGDLSVESVRFGGKNLGGVQGTVRQTGRLLAVSSTHRSRLIPGMTVTAAGSVPIFPPAESPGEFTIDLSRPLASPEIDLGKFFSGAGGIIADGRLAAQARITFGPGSPLSGTTTVTVDQGSLRGPEGGFSLEGIAGSMTLPRLPAIASRPKQFCRFETADLGGVTLTEGRIDCRLESDGRLFIEQSRVRWADGTLAGYAVRVPPLDEDPAFVLYCDRLNIAEIIEQLGAAQASGEGTVSGRIPIRLTEKGPVFDDGFLYSSPGEGGTIHVTGADLITAGVPRGTPEYAQLALAREAMENYHYDWVRMGFSTHGGDLLLALKMDGRPENPLPFVYDETIGGFARVEGEGPGSRFQGIRLDVNFRLPIDKILKYREIFQFIQ